MERNDNYIIPVGKHKNRVIRDLTDDEIENLVDSMMETFRDGELLKFNNIREYYLQALHQFFAREGICLKDNELKYRMI